MDDPTRRCENDTGNETRSPGLPIPSGSPFFLSRPCFLSVVLGVWFRSLWFLNPYLRIFSN